MLYGTTRSKPNQTSHFPPSTWQLCNMQQLQRYLTLKIARFFNIVFYIWLHRIRCYPIFEMHCPANVIMVVAVVLAPNRHQCIANHHRDPSSISGFTSSHQHNTHIQLRPLNKQYLREVGSSATCCWQWVRLLIRIMPYHQFKLSTHHSHS